MHRETRDLTAIAAVSIVVRLVFAGVYTERYFASVTGFPTVVLGVAAAFYIERKWESQKRKEDRKNLLRNLRVELGRIAGQPGHANRAVKRRVVL
ncbi:MAG: hypothetical protein NWF14_02420 [Candidatus Bathyarchaeota archaeon]|nr:hypothetical protein [Candidatus Bathyarchaeota archaeon]